MKRFDAIRSLASRLSFRSRPRRRKSSGMQSAMPVQALEQRKLLSASTSLWNGTLTIRGGSGNDVVEVEKEYGRVEVKSNTRSGHVRTQRFSAWRVDEIVFYGYNGNDSFTNKTDVPSRVYGGNGNDVLVGGSGADYLNGGNDADAITGSEGNDTIDAGAGDDFVLGGSGHDFIDAAFGNDQVFGEDGNDSIYGGSGNDVLAGDDGADFIRGQDGNDRVHGGNHNDRLLGDAGIDVVAGESGNDYVRGGAHKDYLYGGNGHDYMIGDSGSDYMYGNNGNDRLYGYSGNDVMSGGNGQDYLSGSHGNDRMYGGRGNDRMTGGAGSDVMSGNIGNDTMYGAGGRDRLYGGYGQDYMNGNGGYDRIYPGSGVYDRYARGDYVNHSTRYQGYELTERTMSTEQGVSRGGLTLRQAQPIIDHVTRAWEQKGHNVDEAIDAEFRIADLPNGLLALTVHGSHGAPVIWIDHDASGQGWFVDRTPADDREFQIVNGILVARQGSPAAGRMDLQTTIAHEIGHAAGAAHALAADVMLPWSTPSIRLWVFPSDGRPMNDHDHGPGMEAFVLDYLVGTSRLVNALNQTYLQRASTPQGQLHLALPNYATHNGFVNYIASFNRPGYVGGAGMGAGYGIAGLFQAYPRLFGTQSYANSIGFPLGLQPLAIA